MAIIFERIRWKNFLSTGNQFTEIHLNKHSNTLIVGQNGAGKSTILDALTFVLFGKPFRKINKPNLINSINLGDTLVEIEFSIGNKKYLVRRGIKPNIFEIICNNELINQDAKAKDYQIYLEDIILKLNYKSFNQVVILGAASFVPFMQLSAADRRAIIEDLLDIQIFSSMNSVLKDKLTIVKDTQNQLKFNLDLVQEKINLQLQNIEQNKKNVIGEIELLKKEIDSHDEELEKYKSDISLIQKHIDILQATIQDKLQIETKNKKLLQLQGKFENTSSKLKKDISFYDTNDSCPTCLQELQTDFKQHQIHQKQNKLNEIKAATNKLNEELEKSNTRLIEISNIQKKIINHQSEIVKLNTQINSINSYINKLNAKINSLSNRQINIEDDNVKLKELREEHAKIDIKIKETSEEKQYYEFAGLMLKDTGIKTKIIKQYLPIMNKLINKYLSAMDFFVNFTIDENFNEKIKSRHRDEFVYSSFSEGEKQKIDLSLLFTWRQIAKMKNSVSTNLLILDEVFDSSLDISAVECVLKLFDDLSNDTNLFVISHRGDQLFDKFQSTMKFQKRGNFSEVIL